MYARPAVPKLKTSIDIEVSTIQALDEYSEKTGATRSELIRRACRAAIALARESEAK